MIAGPLIAALLLAASAKRPELHVDGPAFDFGSTVFGQIVSHRFTVQNRGDSPLELEAVTAPCGCFSAVFDKNIAPGRAGSVEVRIDTTALSGPFFLNARIQSNDPSQPRSALRITGEVRGAVAVLPRDHLDLTTVAGEDLEQSLVLEVNRKAPLRVTRVESTSGVFVPSLIAESAGKKYRVVVKAKGGHPPGVHRGTVRLLTDDRQRPVIAIECSLLIVSPLGSEPETLFLPALGQDEARKGGKDGRWKVLVKHLRQKPFEIVGLSSDLPFVRAGQKRRDAQSFEVSLELLPNDVLRPGRTVGNLRVTTNLPEAPEITIPVWLEVR